MASPPHGAARVGPLGGVLPCPDEHGALVHGPEYHRPPGELQAA